jgi:hypothetical protein
MVDGAVFNPSGFKARMAFLAGSASQDYAEYTTGWSGRARILFDMASGFPLQYPYLLAPFILIGFVRAMRGARRQRLVVGLLPLLVALSFTVAFNWTARRTNARFLVPQAVMLAVYGGYGLDLVAFAARGFPRIVGQAAVSLALARGIFTSISVDANLLGDPRYDAERWLAEHVKPGDTIEIYGLNVYQLRLPPGARVLRVGPEPLDKRNPLPGVEEVKAPFAEPTDRGAKWVVLSTGWVWRFFQKAEHDLPVGRQMTTGAYRLTTDEPAAQFFDRLISGRTAYAYAHESKYESSLFPNVDVHGTSARLVWIYERR